MHISSGCRASVFRAHGFTLDVPGAILLSISRGKHNYRRVDGKHFYSNAAFRRFLQNKLGHAGEGIAVEHCSVDIGDADDSLSSRQPMPRKASPRALCDDVYSIRFCLSTR